MKMKRTLALILGAILLVGTLAGCGGKSDASLQGEWRTEFDMSSVINESAAESGMSEFVNITDFNIAILMDLNADGTYAMTVDQDALAQSMEGVKTQFKEGMTSYLEDMIAEQGLGISVDDALSAMGMSLDEMIDEAFGEDAIDEMTAGFKTEGQYKAEGGKLYTSESLTEEPGDYYELYTLEGDTLTLDAASAEAAGDMAEFLPLVFTRVG